eukprot:COSAG04_NODE_636_length_11710_cov_63.646973_9_plen_78_part_00
MAGCAFAQVDFCDYVVGPTWEQLSNALGEEPLIKEAQRNMGQNRSSWHSQTTLFRITKSPWKALKVSRRQLLSLRIT